MKKQPITLVVLTFNEEVHLARCLESVRGLVDEILVVDCHSTDRTLDIAGEYGAEIVEHDFKNQADQFNWALDNIPMKGEWILRLDADEYLLPELRDEMTDVLSRVPDSTTAFLMKRRLYFMNRWIRHGGYYPSWFIRLFRKEAGRYECREMDEHVIVSHGNTERLKHDFVDQKLTGLDEFILRHTKYSEREAREVMKADAGSREIGGEELQRKRWVKQYFYLRLPLFWRAFYYFFHRYILRLGFLDGKEGLIFHFLQGCWYRFLVDARIYRAKKENKDV